MSDNRRYSIMGRDYGSNIEVELGRVGTNPEELMKGFRQKSLSIDGANGRKVKIPRYSWLRIVDHEVPYK